MARCGSPSPEREATAPRPARNSTPASSPGQHQDRQSIRFQHLDHLDAPGAHNIEQVFQDTLGFIWFATDNGLVRFDGSDARSFGPVPFDTTSLSESWVRGIVSDGAGGLWITTASAGLNHYNPTRETFQRYTSSVPARLDPILRDQQGRLWIGTSYSGLVRFDPATNTTTQYVADPEDAAALPDDRIEALLLDRNGTLWIGTEAAGLSRLDPSTGQFHTYPVRPGKPDGLPSARVRTLHEDAKGQLWVGTDGGVVRYDPATDAFEDVPGAGGDVVRALHSDPNGVLWVGSEAGLDRYDPATGDHATYRHDETDPASLKRGAVLSLFLDRSGVMWVGGEYGVSFFTWAPSPFQTYGHNPSDPNSLDSDNVLVVYEDRESTLWAGTETGLNRIDRNSGRVTRYPPDPSDPTRLATGLVMGIFETQDGTFWIASRGGGLQKFDRDTGRVVERFAEIPGDSTSLFSDLPWWALEDQQGRTWITSGGAGCLSQMHRDTGTFTRLCHDPEDPNTPAHDFSRYLVEGRDGVLWLGTWGGGLDRIDPETGAFTHYRHDPRNRNSPSSDVILFVGESEDGGLWLGTFGAGFSHFDPATETFTHYTPHDTALPDGTVYGIQPDDAGGLWLSTNAGIVRFDTTTKAFRRFGLADGIPSLEFNSGASFRSRSGELFFGGVKGITAFDPDRVGTNTAAPPVVITGLQVNGEAIPSPASDALSAWPYVTEVRLDPAQRDLAITYAALHYVDPKHNRYRHQLVGYDQTWSPASTERTATYTNLDPGRYTFRVIASNSDGVWNTEGATLAIIVAPRWFETGWAYALYTLLAVGLVTIGIRVRRNRQRLKRQLDREHLEAEHLRQLDRSKSEFFANVSHEFRTPLTLTLGPLDDVLNGEYGPISEDALEPITLAQRSARRVLDLINQMLDVARLEAGQTSLRAQRLDLGDVVARHVEAFASLAERRRITTAVHLDSLDDAVYADPEHLGTILSNLLSNAYKFTPEGGTVRVTLEAAETEARIRVQDSGPGIPASDLPHVFDRFYQVANSQRPLGTGIGLALANELAGLHGGTLMAESTVGIGSTFTLALPLGTSHLEPTQIVETNASRPVLVTVEPSVDTRPEATGDEDGEDITTVLIVEDNAEIRAYARRHLESVYRVLDAPDGEAGLAMAHEHLPDLVVSDVMMPRMDGYTLCHALKSDPATDFIPVILLTARAEQADRLEGLRQHADAYLTKPFDPVELKARAENLIGIRARLRERFASSVAAGGDGALPAVPESADDRFLAAVREAIEMHFGDETFSVERLADAVGMSRGHLHRQLKTIAGRTPSQMLRARRLARAAELLEAETGTVSEVGYAVGFKSVAHFSNAFEQAYGCRPSVYRGQASTSA